MFRAVVPLDVRSCHAAGLLLPLIVFYVICLIFLLQERILLDRERVMTKTWYNDERNRWEMDPVAVPYAISKKLVGGARIRHDWGAMYLTLKGDDKEYHVDIKVSQMFITVFFFLLYSLITYLSENVISNRTHF